MRKSTCTNRGWAVEMLEGRVLLSGTPHGFAHTNVMVRGVAAAGLTPAAGSEITPAQMVQAYGVNQVMFGSVHGNGAGQTIAIIDAYHDATANSDLQAFDNAYGLPSGSVTVYDENGGQTYPDPAQNHGSWLIEESLDIEWAHVIAPAANLILYEASSTSDADLITAAVNTARNNPSVTAISMSWGTNGEFSGESTYDSTFTSPHATFLAATGDSGYPGGYPAYSPNVVAVGGTTLTVDSNGNWVSEAAWSGSGGGTSSQEPQPAYQNGFQNTGWRTIPDVAMDADYNNSPVPVYSNGVLYDVGGTSLACPMFAGIIAIANQGRVVNGLSPLSSSQAQPLLYQSASNYLLTTPKPAPTFHDITSGSNQNAGGGFNAGPGYDEVTGLGSPVANLLTQYLAGTKPALLGKPVINGDNPNGLYTAAGQSAPGTQRSMVEDVVYSFNEPVTIANANTAFTVAVAGPAGGTVPSTLYAQAVPGSGGAQWAVSLTGMPEGTIGSIANGEYSITVNPAAVVATDDGTTPLTAGRTDRFYRLYGDVFATENVIALDYNRFKGSLTTYNPMFDNYNTGNITALDYNLFKKDLTINYAGDGFVTTI